MPKRTQAQTNVAKSSKTDLSLHLEVMESPYFTHQAMGATLDTQNGNIKVIHERETDKCTDIDNENQSREHSTTAEEEDNGASSAVPSTSLDPSREKLNQDFYEQDSITLAKELLGQVVVRVVDGQRISGRIVETESYLGGPDVASHSYNGKRTPRTEPMYMKPGTSYVYSIYGMYYCFNISSKGDGSCVLLRALEALEGLEQMQFGRRGKRKDPVTPLKLHQLCNGPSKLCQALYLTKDSNNKVDLANSNNFWLEHGSPVPESSIVVSKRIGIDGCGEEWANKPLRFYQLGSKSVSVRDKVAEEKL